MNVLHVTPTMSAESGGPRVTVRGLTTALGAEGVQCEIATTMGGRYRQPPSAVPDVPMHVQPTSPFASAWNAHSSALARVVAGQVTRFDVVHVHELWHHPGFAACRAAHRHGIPVVLSMHGCLDALALGQKRGRKQLYLKLTRRLLQRSVSVLHALTDVEAAQADRLGVPTPVTVIPNGVPAELPDAVEQVDTTAFGKRFPALAGKRVVLFLGRLAPRKGVDVLARSFVDVARRLDDVALLVVGPNRGDTQEQAQTLLASAGLLDRAVFTGALDGADKLGALACADVFVLPSEGEGFSNAVLEAMAAGLPVVVSEQCRFPAVAERSAGMVVRSDAAEVGQAICALLGDDRRRQEAARNARRLVAEHYLWPTVAASFAELYRSLVPGVADHGAPR